MRYDMKKLLFIAMSALLVLAAGCSMYQEEVYEISSYDAGIGVLLSDSTNASLDHVSMFTDLLSVDSTMTTTNYDSLIMISGTVRTNLDSVLNTKNAILAVSVNRIQASVKADVAIALLNLTGAAENEYKFYFDSFMDVEIYTASTGEAVETDNSFPLEMVAAQNLVKGCITVTLPGANYFFVLKRTEASKTVNLVGMTFTASDFEGVTDVCSVMNSTSATAINAKLPTDINPDWTAIVFNSAFIINAANAAKLDSALLMLTSVSQTNAKYQVTLTDSATNGYFVLNMTSAKTIYTDQLVTFAVYSVVDTSDLVIATATGLSMNELMGCNNIGAKYQYTLDVADEYIVLATPAEGVETFTMVVK